jgi:hypothetical protein
METFSSFKESNLYSKKEWLLPNHIVYYLNFLTPFVFAFILFDMYRSFILIKHKVILFVLIYFGYILADYITAFVHCFFIDESYSTEEFPMENGNLISDTPMDMRPFIIIFHQTGKISLIAQSLQQPSSFFLFQFF